MAAILSLTESQILKALGDFLTNILPAGVEIDQGQDNRVPEPRPGDYVVMWPTLRERLETNEATVEDITLVGGIAGATLTVASIQGGTLQAGSVVFAAGLTAGVTVTALGAGAGGVGTCTVSPPATVAPGTALAAGMVGVRTAMKLTVQIDVHGPNSTDNTQIIVSLFRDEYGCDFFVSTGIDVQPLYIDDGSQIPFVNGENQYEDRWVLLAKLQANPVVSTSLQFADTLTIDLKEIDTTYPPGA